MELTDPGALRIVFVVLLLSAVGLYFLGQKGVGGVAGVGRATIAGLAFVLWTMLQPASAFDAFDWSIPDVIKITGAAVCAVLLAALANWLAVKADKKPSTT